MTKQGWFLILMGAFAFVLNTISLIWNIVAGEGRSLLLPAFGMAIAVLVIAIGCSMKRKERGDE